VTHAAAAAAAIDPLLLSLLSIFGGVMLSIVAGWAGAGLQSRREHRKWERDQRLKTYADFLSASDNFIGAAQRNDDADLAAVLRESLTASAVMRLIGPDDAYEAAARLQKAAQASVQALSLTQEDLDRSENERTAARNAFIEIARAKVKIKG
jgi:hypothetical protein